METELAEVLVPSSADIKVGLAKVVLGSIAGFVAQALTAYAVDRVVEYRSNRAIEPTE